MQLKSERPVPENLIQEAVESYTAGFDQRAEDICRHVLTKEPRHAEALHLIARVLLRKGDFIEALARCERALGVRPNDADMLNTRGLVLHRLQRYDEALASYAKALASRPKDADVLFNRAALLWQIGRRDESLLNFEKGLALKPDEPEALLNYGYALSQLEQLEAALRSYDRALELRPDFLHALINRGRVLHGLGRYREALESYDRALSIDPACADAHNNKGALLRDLGRLDEARQSCAKALELRPTSAIFYLNFAHSQKFMAEDPRLAAMESLSTQHGALTPDDEIKLRFALAKAYADCAKHELAFTQLREANRLQRQQVEYDERGALKSFGYIQAAFSGEMMRRKIGGGDPSRMPVFIVGMPRSGTTLVEQILASHSKVFGAGEIPHFNSAARRALQMLGGFPQGASAISADQLHQLGSEYLARLQAMAPANAERITDKLPGNFHHVGLIHLALPNARIIHVHRNPVDTCFSCFATLFNAPHPYSYDLSELGRYYRAYTSLMEHWRNVLPQGVMLELRYEDLISNFERETRRLLAHCDLELEKSCLSFYVTERLVHTASAFQVRQPLYATSVGRWQPYERWLKPLFEALAPILPPS